MVSFILPGNSASGEYEVANSLRFNDDSSDYLSITPGSSSNTKKWTFSCWIKLGNIKNSFHSIFTAFTGSTDQYNAVALDNSNRVVFITMDEGSGGVMNVISNAMLRDPSAWYHIVTAYDSAQATDTNRVKGYINGTQVTSLSTSNYPAQDKTTYINSNNQHNIGKRWNANYYDGYMAEVVFIDGQALTPTSFGEFDSDTNIWKPIDVSGLTFGTNGFYLDFEDGSALGDDVSGNNNDFTVNNLTSVDQSTDTCTNNFATFNSLAGGEGGALPTFANGNLDIIRGSASWRTGIATIGGLTQGKWYYECKAGTINASNAYIQVGVSSESAAFTNVNSYHDSNYSYAYHWDGSKYVNNSATASWGSAITTGDIVMIALDFDNNYIYAGLNGTWQNSGDPTSGSSGTGALSSLQSGESWFPSVSVYNTTHEVNFGSPAFTISSGNSDGNGYGNFEYSVPSGYYSLNSKNLAEYG